jgi:proteasome lid subunit RPN8/RPN11
MVAEASFVLRVPESIYQETVAHVVAGYPNEACGVLGCKGDLIVKHYPTANSAKDPSDFSIISSADQLPIFKDVDDYDGVMVYYHSHPHSEAYPSARDNAWARENSNLYIIFTLQHYPEPASVRVFTIARDGEVTEGKVEVF